jgi:transcription elongation GreA/GreB family factor
MTAQLLHGPTPPTADKPSAGTGAHATGPALMTAARLEELRDERERLRAQTRIEIAQQLREPRAFGGGSNNGEIHAVREEQMVIEARIASLEETVADAAIVDPGDAERGAAVIGSAVLIEDLDSGTVGRYRVASAPPPARSRHHSSRLTEVSFALQSRRAGRRRAPSSCQSRTTRPAASAAQYGTSGLLVMRPRIRPGPRQTHVGAPNPISLQAFVRTHHAECRSVTWQSHGLGFRPAAAGSPSRSRPMR